MIKLCDSSSLCQHVLSKFCFFVNLVIFKYQLMKMISWNK